MYRYLTSAAPAIPILLLVVASFDSRLQAGQPADALAAIKKLGGSVRLLRDNANEWEVEFHLQGRELTDKGLTHVAALNNVVSLNLRDTKITGAGLVHLKNLTTLRSLHLERTKVGDDGIENLAGLVNLEYLNLYGTNVTDKSLEHLTRLKKLNRLYVWETKVTDAGVAKLAKALPESRIVRGVDLAKLPATTIKTASKAPVLQKWIAASDEKPPKSKLGVNISVVFENKTSIPVKLFWISYGGELKQYGELAPGAMRRQNSYSLATWLITDGNDTPLGYFITTADQEALAVIPNQKK